MRMRPVVPAGALMVPRTVTVEPAVRFGIGKSFVVPEVLELVCTQLIRTESLRSVTGEPLPSMPEMAPGSYFTDTSTDKAIGMPAPSIDGSSFDGSPVKVDTGDGTPRVIVFVAHWCPHCQKEVPAIQQWIDDGNLPKGVEIVYVSTGVAPERGNYPVSDWIEKEGVTPKVVLDDDQSAAASDYGLSGFPYFVMIDGQGKVVARGSGEIPMDVFGPAVDALAAGQDPTAAS